ncbi:HlyC/CorC family transporter [bacterium]|nr:HlyC/CorC family transporter [bacterium]
MGFFRSLESEEDFHRLIDEGEEEGIIEEEEHDLIHSVFEFRDTIVREVMVPRVDIAAIPLKATLDEVLDIIIEKGHSRIPVYDQNMDNIVGIVYAKDILKVFKSDKRDIVITDIMRPPYFVPETKKIMDLLKEFQVQKIHMAIVVDEYGGTAGLVTIEDLLEELVGEIQDEYDNERERLVRLNDNTISVDAHINVEEIEEFFDCKIPEEDFETVGGLIFHLFERIPKEGEDVTFQGLRFIVRKADERRVLRVEISRVHEKDQVKPE